MLLSRAITSLVLLFTLVFSGAAMAQDTLGGNSLIIKPSIESRQAPRAVRTQAKKSAAALKPLAGSLEETEGLKFVENRLLCQIDRYHANGSFYKSYVVSVESVEKIPQTLKAQGIHVKAAELAFTFCSRAELEATEVGWPEE